MPPWTVLKENKDFRAAYYRGKALVHPLIIVYVKKNRLHTLRMGITTGKKIGKAVQRSRCRRVIREAFRAIAPRLEPSYDYVLVARTRTVFAKSTDVQKVLEDQFTKAGLLK